MQTRILCIAGYLFASCGLGALAAPNRAPAPNPAALSEEQRTTVVTLRPALETVDNTVQRLAGALHFSFLGDDRANTIQTGESLCVQRSLGGRVVYRAGRGTTAGAWTVALEVALPATWRRVEGVRVLTDLPELAPFAAMGLQDLTAASSKALEPLKTLTPAQAERLLAGDVLYPRDLTPEQLRGVTTAVQLDYLRMDMVAPKALQLENVYVRIKPVQRSPDYQPPPEVSVFVPLRDGGGLAIHSMGYRLFKVEPPVARPGQRPDGRVPGRLTPVQPNQGEAVDLGKEDQLAVPVEIRGTPTTYEVLTAVHGKDGPDLLTVTLLGYRKLSLPAAANNAAQPRKQSRREWMQAVQEVTGGTWVKVEDTFVLRPHPLVERAAELDEHFNRKGQLLPLLTELTRQLRLQNALPKRDKVLPSEKLDRRYQEVLRWVMALQFADAPGVPRDALELKGVTLRRIPLKKEINAPGPALEALEYVFRTGSGEEKVLGSVPL